MALSPSSAKMGPGRIYFGPAGSETELGVTEEGLKLQIGMPVEQDKCDEFGEEPIAEYSAGTVVTCSVTLREWTLAKLLIALPGSAQGTGTGSNTSWNFGPRAGIDLSGTSYAKRLRWHPSQTTDTTDESDDTILYKCAPRLAPGQDISLSLKKGRGLNLIGTAFRDTSVTTESNQFGKWSTDV